jgi:shikimate kinase
MKNIVLIGFMGCGKSTLGKKLASKLNYHFIDSDSEIEQATGMSISQLFDTYGEDYFRDLESDFLETIKDKQQIVLSTGGGMPCFNKNIEKINVIGDSFYMKLSPYELAKRLFHAKKKRPLIQQFEDEEALYYYIKEKLNERKSFYEQAHFTLNGKQQNVQSLLEKLEQTP